MVWDPRALGPQIPPEVHVPPAHPQFRQPQEAQPESKVQQQLQLKLQVGDENADSSDCMCVCDFMCKGTPR
jgi:hypothetical protein